MNKARDKKVKKLLKPSQPYRSLVIPTNVAVGPLGFRAELDIGPKGEQNRSYRDPEETGLIRPRH
jgi:hypothetical protein